MQVVYSTIKNNGYLLKCMQLDAWRSFYNAQVDRFRKRGIFAVRHPLSDIVLISDSNDSTSPTTSQIGAHSVTVHTSF